MIIVSAIDNVVKGASGQAVQNMNLLFGLPEDTALAGPGLYPRNTPVGAKNQVI